MVLFEVGRLGPLQQQPLDGFPRPLGVVVLRSGALADAPLDRGKERSVPVPVGREDLEDLPEPVSALPLHRQEVGQHVEELVVRIGFRQRPDDVGIRDPSVAVCAVGRIPGAFIEGQDDRDPLLDREPVQRVSEAAQDPLDHFGGDRVGGGLRPGVLAIPLTGGIRPAQDGRDHLGGDVEIPGKIPASLPGGHVLREDHPPELVLPVGGWRLLAREEDPSRENFLVVVRVDPDPPHTLRPKDLVELLPRFFHTEPLEGEEENEEFLRGDLVGEVEGGDLLQEELGGEAADEAVAVAEEDVLVKDLVLGDAEQEMAGRLPGRDFREVPVELLHAAREGRVPRLVHRDPVERQGHFHREPLDPANIRRLRRAFHRLPRCNEDTESLSDGRARIFTAFGGKGMEDAGRIPDGK